MKGYLQRLVQTVTSPAESVHPWTGSMFAAGHHGDFNVVQTDESAPVTAVRQSLDVMGPASAQSSTGLAPTETSPPRAEHNSTISELRARQIPGDFRQAGRSGTREPSLTERIIFEPLISDTERSAPEGADATELDDRPSLAGAEAVIKPRNTRPIAASLSPLPQAKSDARALAKPVAEDRQTDEIQIHIGRIEVTAIRPAAATVPKARDKEINLDAYLKRRDGRGR